MRYSVSGLNASNKVGKGTSRPLYFVHSVNASHATTEQGFPRCAQLQVKDNKKGSCSSVYKQCRWSQGGDDLGVLGI